MGFSFNTIKWLINLRLGEKEREKEEEKEEEEEEKEERERERRKRDKRRWSLLGSFASSLYCLALERTRGNFVSFVLLFFVLLLSSSSYPISTEYDRTHKSWKSMRKTLKENQKEKRIGYITVAPVHRIWLDFVSVFPLF